MRRSLVIDCLALCLVLVLTGCAETPKTDKFGLSPVSFQDIPGWQNDHQAQTLGAFVKSCAVLAKKDPDQRFVLPQAGSAQDWRAACEKLPNAANQADETARHYFETNFIPYAVTAGEPGLFTGYYEAQLRGSLTPSARYAVPLWQRPDDLLTADLGAFRSSLQGQKIVGKAAGRSFVPYDDRAAIAGGSLWGRAVPLLWADDPVETFFLEIQGSGRVQLENGEEWRIGYEAQNGRDYQPIGRMLAERGEIDKPVTMAKIRSWLTAHPESAQEIMNLNPSVVFFHRLAGEGPVGAQGVALTPMRSMAVDPRYVPLGAPLFLVTQAHRRLVVAQDTGGAIKGSVRGDLFWGHGVEAEAGAGVMQESGTYYILLPKKDAAP